MATPWAWMASTCGPTTSTELHPSWLGPGPSSNKEHSRRCQSFQPISPSCAFPVTNSFRARISKKHIAFPWKQRHRKEAPTVAMARVTPAGCRTDRGWPIATAVDSSHRKWLRPRKQAGCKASRSWAAQAHQDTSSITSMFVDTSWVSPSQQQQPHTLAPDLPTHVCPLWTTCQPATPH